MYSLKQKFKFTLDGPVKSIPCPVTVDGVRAVKIRWLYYQTSAPGEKEMQIRISELRGNGMEVSAGANARYLLCIPLDQNAFTTLTYSNYQQEMDAVYNVPISTINELNFEIKINDIIANQITSGNPINLEIGFYE
jgi:hypothetical protein